MTNQSFRAPQALEGVVARARHIQHAAQPGDAMVCLLRIDQPEAVSCETQLTDRSVESRISFLQRSFIYVHLPNRF
jgi:hypothetical protein